MPEPCYPEDRFYFFVIFSPDARRVVVGQYKSDLRHFRIVNRIRAEQKMPDAIVLLYQVPEFPRHVYVCDSGQRLGAPVVLEGSMNLKQAQELGRLISGVNLEELPEDASEGAGEDEAPST